MKNRIEKIFLIIMYAVLGVLFTLATVVVIVRPININKSYTIKYENLYELENVTGIAIKTEEILKVGKNDIYLLNDSEVNINNRKIDRLTLHIKVKDKYYQIQQKNDHYSLFKIGDAKENVNSHGRLYDYLMGLSLIPTITEESHEIILIQKDTVPFVNVFTTSEDYVFKNDQYYPITTAIISESIRYDYFEMNIATDLSKSHKTFYYPI
jgi:hypothetical protein